MKSRKADIRSSSSSLIGVVISSWPAALSSSVIRTPALSSTLSSA